MPPYAMSGLIVKHNTEEDMLEVEKMSSNVYMLFEALKSIVLMNKTSEM
jgi:hypothetical protein